MVEEPETIGDVAELIKDATDTSVKVKCSEETPFTDSHARVRITGKICSRVFQRLLSHGITVAAIRSVNSLDTDVWFDRIETEERVVEVTETVNTFENVD